MDLERLLREHGALKRAHLVAASMPRRAIDAAFRAYPTPRRGIIAAPDLPAPALEALRLGGSLTCASAAAHHGLWLLRRPSALHVATTHGRRLPASTFRIIRHRGAADGLLSTSIADLCFHAATCLPVLEAAVVLESAVASGQASLAGLSARLESRGGQAREVLRLVRGIADSPVEVVVRAGLMHRAIAFEEQVMLRDVGRVDFLVEGWLIVEVDGWAWHGNQQAWQNDALRGQNAARRGFHTLRFTASDVLWRADTVFQTLQTVLRTNQPTFAAPNPPDASAHLADKA
ncbi:endonuclease domain-containing protein [Zhihengliuella flava]|uniref:Very-short-patch-repair endonuclease n=1 Tax=Zhihengliuella flava TaxID=1285193 RepID=A0A931D726_9MICC|nr:DUF559 domain-containing protein [Zhihengliuella flava]MBG6084880.1 very-short-patch-repair endonuclease [Zhihengliuella flava]